MTRGRKAALGLAVALGVLLAAEVLFRVWVGVVDRDLGERIATHRERFAPMSDLTNLLYAPHPYWVYNARPNQPGVNSWGFNFDELDLDKPRGVTRIATLGGSTTAGPKAWPYHLQQVLTERYPGETVEVLNFGTQGWTTQESTAVYTLLAQSFDPDLVIVHHANNDIDPMIRADFRSDYAHFRKPIALSQDELGAMRLRLGVKFRLDSLGVQVSSLYVYARLWLVGDQPTVYTLNTLTTHEASGGVLPDGSANAWAFERNLRTIAAVARGHGGDIAVATIPHVQSDQMDWGPRLERQNQRLMALARSEGWTAIPLHEMDLDPNWFEDPIHVNQDGERAKAEGVADVVGPKLFGR